MKKFFTKVWKYLKADGPAIIQQAIVALISVLMQVGISDMAEAPKERGSMANDTIALPASWSGRFKWFAAEVVSVGAVLSTILALVINYSSVLNVPSHDVAVLVVVASVVAGVVAEARHYVNTKLQARK